jgi:hypothetical protein
VQISERKKVIILYFGPINRCGLQKFEANSKNLTKAHSFKFNLYYIFFQNILPKQGQQKEKISLCDLGTLLADVLKIEIFIGTHLSPEFKRVQHGSFY